MAGLVGTAFILCNVHVARTDRFLYTVEESLQKYFKPQIVSERASEGERSLSLCRELDAGGPRQLRRGLRRGTVDSATDK